MWRFTSLPGSLIKATLVWIGSALVTDLLTCWFRSIVSRQLLITPFTVPVVSLKVVSMVEFISRVTFVI